MRWGCCGSQPGSRAQVTCCPHHGSDTSSKLLVQSSSSQALSRLHCSRWPRLGTAGRHGAGSAELALWEPGRAEEQEAACYLGCPAPSARAAKLYCASLEYWIPPSTFGKRAGAACAAGSVCHWSSAALWRCLLGSQHVWRTSRHAAKLYLLAAQTHPRTHRAGADKDKSLTGNCNSSKKNVTFGLYLSLWLAVIIIAIVSATIAVLPEAAESALSSIVFSTNAPKPLKKPYSSECKWLTMVKRRDKIKWIQLA